MTFKESFKYYKTKLPVPQFNEVIDFDQPIVGKAQAVQEYCHYQCTDANDATTTATATVLSAPLGLHPVETWRCYTLPQHPGLIVVRNPFTVQGQRYWIARCLRDYPREPNVVNLSAQLFTPAVLADWWRELQQLYRDRDRDNSNRDEARRLKISLRWATLGYHHNWDTKLYSENAHSPFPTDLAALSSFIARALGCASAAKPFEAQAAIVNYYPIGTTLSGHTDHSEPNVEAPLFSFSFGQTAIFLIGGQTKDKKPTALYLQHGDVLVMTHQSRLCYHAVPRVMKARMEPWNADIATHHSTAPPPHKKPKLEHTVSSAPAPCGMDLLLYQQVADEVYWLPYKTYLNDSRININVRQVLHVGDERLPPDSTLADFKHKCA